LPVEFMRKLNMKVAFEKDASGVSLQDKFNARVQWIQHTKQQRPKVEEPETSQLTAEEKASKAKSDALNARYQRIVAFIRSTPMTRHCRAKMESTYSELVEKRVPIDEIEKEVSAVYRDVSGELPMITDPLKLARLHIRAGEKDSAEIEELLRFGRDLGLWELPMLSAKDCIEDARKQFARQIAWVRKSVFQALVENQKRNDPHSGRREALFEEMCFDVQRNLNEWEFTPINSTVGLARAQFDVAITGVSFEQRPNCRSCNVAKASARYLDLSDTYTILPMCDSCARASLEIPISRNV
jgi:hypothetical protein